MPHLPNDDDPLRGKLRIVLSPAAELFNSLHVLAEPAHHPSNAEWATAASVGMAAELRVEVAVFGQHFAQWLGIADAFELAGPVDMPVPVFLDALGRLPPELLLRAALEEFVMPGYQAPDPPSDAETREAQDAARADPAAFAGRVVGVLRRYWGQVFAAEWEQRRPLLEQRRAQEAARLDAMPPLRWLASLHDRIEVVQATQEIIFHKARDVRFRLDQLALIRAIPSTFSAPHLMVSYFERRLTIYINVAPTLPPTERVPAALLGVAKALADETRLRIYKLTLRQPRYTQELASALGLAEPTVSRHLKVLKGAGLVRSRKEGGVVLYAGVLDPVDRLPAALREFIRG
jgi:DNA-binding transcriptional ArsR family regulator